MKSNLSRDFLTIKVLNIYYLCISIEKRSCSINKVHDHQIKICQISTVDLSSFLSKQGLEIEVLIFSAYDNVD